MDLKFKPVEAEDIMEMTPLFCQRPNKTCDSVALDSFYGVIIIMARICNPVTGKQSSG